MNQRLIASAVLAWGIAALAATPAHAQRRSRASFSRPSQNAASARLGLVGGLHTGRYGDPSRLTNVAPTGLGPAGRGLSQPNFFGGGWSMARLPAPAMPRAFLPGQVGVVARPTASLWGRALSGPQVNEIAWASRLQASFSLAVPLTGIGPTEIQLPYNSYFAPPPAGTEFHAFYGLTPTEPRSDLETEIPADGWVALLELENSRAVANTWKRARELFKAATEDKVAGRFEYLAEAGAALRVVRDLDREAYIPCLLLLHVALERNQVLLAASHLTDAARRHPSVFVERPNLAAYFHDHAAGATASDDRSKVLEQTARAYLKIGDLTGRPEAYAVQAYCAWILDDQARLKGALAQLTVGKLGPRNIERLSDVRNALAATTNR